jgi:Uma2 family endonuclease
MGMVSPPRADWTVKRVHALPYDGNRYEIIDGELFVTPAPQLVHQAIVSELFLLVGPYAKRVGLDPLTSPADITFSDRTLVQPDIFVLPKVNGRRIATYAEISSLILTVEVLSKSSRKLDRGKKRLLFQREGVPEYWIVDGDARVIERWRPGASDAEVLTATLAWQPVASHAPLEIDLVAFFSDIFPD